MTHVQVNSHEFRVRVSRTLFTTPCKLPSKYQLFIHKCYNIYKPHGITKYKGKKTLHIKDITSTTYLNNKSGQLTIADRCALVQGHSRSSTFVAIESPYDFLLVINCYLSSSSQHFRDIASRTRSRTTPHKFEPPDQRDPFRISESN